MTLLLRRARRARVLAAMEAGRRRLPRRRPRGERPLRLGRAAAVDGRLPGLRSGLRLRAGDRGGAPAEHVGRGHPRGDPPREPVRHHLQRPELREGAAEDRGRGHGQAGWPPTPCRARRPTCCPRRSRRPSSSTASRCCARSAGSRAPRRSRPSGRRCAWRRRRSPRRPHALVPGVTERQLTAIFMEAMAAAGVTTPVGTGRGVDHLAPETRGAAPTATRRCNPATWWPSRPAWSSGAMPERWAVPYAVREGGHIDSELAQRTSALWERLLDACRSAPR